MNEGQSVFSASLDKPQQSPKLGVMVESYTEDDRFFYVQDRDGTSKYSKAQYAPIYGVVEGVSRDVV